VATRTGAHDAKWLLLLHQLPARASNARVKTWRRLQHLGALPLRNSAYVLPNTPEAREDFEWMRAEIVGMGGQASVFEGSPSDPRMDAELVAGFRAARTADFKVLAQEIAGLERKARPARGGASRAHDASFQRRVRGCRDRAAEIAAIDFFTTPLGAQVESALNKLEARVRPGTQPARRVVRHPAREAPKYRGRTWVTRPRPAVDRMASAWLIRAFVDPQAAFVFGERPSSQQIPFDMYEGAFSHHGGLCTFEVIAETFRIADPAVRRIAEIVHDVDLKDGRFAPPEAATVAALVDGLRAMYEDDQTALQRGIDLFQALYGSMSAGGTRPAPRRAKRSR